MRDWRERRDSAGSHIYLRALNVEQLIIVHYGTIIRINTKTSRQQNTTVGHLGRDIISCTSKRSLLIMQDLHVFGLAFLGIRVAKRIGV